jgi:hypothetical protein
MAMTTACGCGTRADAEPSAAPTTNDDMPVVNLPSIDFAKPSVSVEQTQFLKALDVDVPYSDFVVRFKGSISPGQRHKSVIFMVERKSKSGTLVTTASCILKPVGTIDGPVAIYEGICTKPARQADVLISIRSGRGTYLVRTATIR